jgi:hypothetical protein
MSRSEVGFLKARIDDMEKQLHHARTSHMNDLLNIVAFIEGGEEQEAMDYIKETMEVDDHE